MTVENPDIGKLEKKVDKLAEELAEVRKEVKSIASMESTLKEMSKQIAALGKIEDILKGLNEVNTTLKTAANSDDIKNVSNKLEKIEESLLKSKDTYPNDLKS